jgi:hypothetical protein
MGEVIQFPRQLRVVEPTGPQYLSEQEVELLRAWDDAAGAVMERKMAPVYDRPGDVPARFWHSWFKLVYALKAEKGLKTPEQMPMETLWRAFETAYLEYQTDWHRAIGNKGA